MSKIVDIPAQLSASAPSWSISLSSFYTTPNPLVGGMGANGSGVFRSTYSLSNITCDGPSACDCRLFSRQGEMQLFDCSFGSPVNGNYSFLVFDEAGHNNSALDMVSLAPGQSAQIIVQRIVMQQPISFEVTVAVILVALAVLFYGSFKFFDWLFGNYRKVAELTSRKKEIEQEFKVLKYRFMKREIDEMSFRKAWADNEKEYTELKRKLGDYARAEQQKK